MEANLLDNNIIIVQQGSDGVMTLCVANLEI